MSVVIVESPSKAKTISKYLGNKVKVIASFGHIRDFPAKNGSVNPNKDFAMVYEIIKNSEKYVNKMVQVVSNETKEIYLATDPDREGEAIAWHIIEVLKERNAINDNVRVARMIFNEVTKKAITSAISNTRNINMDLVYAQQARRALDYLVGFTLSPVLWRKLPGSRSAGRVQSVALRLICDKEDEVEKFVIQEYWSIDVELQNECGDKFSMFLKYYDGHKFEKFDIQSDEKAQELSDIVKGKDYYVVSVENKQVKRNPYPPFITSSLQQEASTKLGFSAKSTMMTAQKLYEGIDIGGEIVGLITYMRTDGFYIADEAVNSIRDMIVSYFGEKYLSKSIRKYVKKVKNAQEAHEAIRPTNITITPSSIEKYLTNEQFKLYELIWKRAIASQMESAVINQVVVSVQSKDAMVILHAVGSALYFDGYYKAYSDNEDIRKTLPVLEVGDHCKLLTVTPVQHFTQPPPRYTEASLVKKMEEIGIGRPSTYASIISVLQDRGYAFLKNKKFIPSERGRIVNIFLINFFSRYVKYDFTANLEEELDLISNGRMNWKEVLKQFWGAFIENINSVKNIEFGEILKSVTNSMENYIFTRNQDGTINKKCPTCMDGELVLNLNRKGMFLGCSKYPECKYVKGIGDNDYYCDEDEIIPKGLGIDDVTGKEIYLKKGPYGMYLQLGDDKNSKRVAIPKNIQNISFDVAKKIISLPINLGCYPETQQEIKIGIGKFGAYILYQNKYFSIKNREDFFNLTLEEAITIIDNDLSKKAKFIGIYEKTGKEIYICKGRYGFYLKCDKINVALKNDTENIDLSDAIKLISSKL
ncbi:type I DNA topoisomerase [Neoehrlichia mikurensis]|uniref:DNA topoisomerase 1 n=1 Tax=Neoehrlichia mikurensis TaxID=89586 RepID=A0ABY5EX11_9RICK|nr:type I DNA topoisomerase [Neoehrlichia mikurensis]QXK92045.1 type I DNA topoisomerase [Neoehrlichia mikurensis]QXK92502.1 type I DNA topoisomerase [Neoehrlichia mikurensis]QXK93738.1 type I DNA topoisomerase [Neoehrlichia mikurensis]UTO56209.1 type I DNA topoisomerase [Neoehrlichia mikurensis]